jgi:glutathione transport system permease protein
MKSLLIPAIILGTAYGGLTARMVRSSMLEIIREDYMRTAYAKGLSDGTVIRRHALKNALIPVVTLAGVQLGGLLNGSIVVELVFNLPGLGLNFIEAVRSRDFPVVQTLVLIFTVAYGLLNLSVDVLYAWLNPRIRYH